MPFLPAVLILAAAYFIPILIEPVRSQPGACLQIDDHTTRQRCYARQQDSRVPCLQIRDRDGQLACQVENGAPRTWCMQIQDSAARDRCRYGLN